MIVVIVGSLMLGMGINLLLVYTGVVTGDSFKAQATINSCEAGDCSVTYEHEGRQQQAILKGTSQTFDGGTTETVTVYRSELQTAYPEHVVPLGFALSLALLGLLATVVGSVQLYRYWKSANRPAGAAPDANDETEETK